MARRVLAQEKQAYNSYSLMSAPSSKNERRLALFEFNTGCCVHHTVAAREFSADDSWQFKRERTEFAVKRPGDRHRRGARVSQNHHQQA